MKAFIKHAASLAVVILAACGGANGEDVDLTTAALGEQWTFCANQNGRCEFEGTRAVRYGARGRTVVKTFTDGVDCNNNAIGTNPYPGVAKRCEYDARDVAPPPPPVPAPPPPPPVAGSHSGYYVSGADLHDRCGEKIILRGVNKMVMYTDQTAESFPEIAKTGANAVRFMWWGREGVSKADAVLQKAVDAKLIPIWELHDATGDWSKMPDVESFWMASATLALLKKYEADLIINIANEGGDTVDDGSIVSTYTRIMTRLRAAGVNAPFMIDAARWGRNVEQLIKNGPALINADPAHNVLLSWHLYDAGEPGRIDSQLTDAYTKKLPLVIGEFGPVEPANCKSAVEYQHLMAKANELGMGYLPWSWDNSNDNCGAAEALSPMNIVGDGIHLSTLRQGFGATVINTDPASISKTAKRGRWATTRTCAP